MKRNDQGDSTKRNARVALTWHVGWSGQGSGQGAHGSFLTALSQLPEVNLGIAGRYSKNRVACLP
jgi:hypothetical protein